MRTHTDSIIPGALTIAVSSGKGGVGKTTTAVALAAALAARDLDVVVLDADIAGTNVHLVADVPDLTLGVRKDQLKLELPRSPYGFRVASPDSFRGSLAQPGTLVSVGVPDLIGAARFADPAQVVVVDLPPGWTKHHEDICHQLPDLVLTVTAPTETAIADHRRHVAQWQQHWSAAVKAVRERDRRRKVDLPEQADLVAVETMARFTGLPDGGGDPITVRRLDAVATELVAELVDPVVSIPSAGTLAETAALPEVSKLADMVTERLGD